MVSSHPSAAAPLFSRMYLGVHTPLDVVVSVGLALALIFGLYPIIHKAFENKTAMRILLGRKVLLSLGLLLFVSFYKFPQDVDAHNLASGTKTAYKMVGYENTVITYIFIKFKHLKSCHIVLNTIF